MFYRLAFGVKASVERPVPVPVCLGTYLSRKDPATEDISSDATARVTRASVPDSEVA